VCTGAKVHYWGRKRKSRDIAEWCPREINHSDKERNLIYGCINNAVAAAPG